MNRKEFEKLIRQKFNKKDADKIMLGYRLSKYGHRGQERDCGGRYFEHPKRVALILLKELRIFDPDMVISALLHDIKEDSFIFADGDIKSIFGAGVERIVSFLTKDRKKSNSENFKKLKNADKKVRLVKLADRLDNLRDMKVWSNERKYKYVMETEELILPWAEETDKNIARELKEKCVEINGLPITHKLVCDYCKKREVASITLWPENNFVEVVVYTEGSASHDEKGAHPIADVKSCQKAINNNDRRGIVDISGKILQKKFCVKCNKFYCYECERVKFVSDGWSVDHYAHCPLGH